MLQKISKYAWIATGLSLFIGIVLVSFDIVGYGTSFFVVLPIGIGFAMGINAPDADRVAGSLVYSLLALVAALVFALVFGLEGMVCILMALPIALFLILVGYLLALISRRTFLKKYEDNDGKAYSVFLPLAMLLISNLVEELFTSEPQTISVTTSVQLTYRPDVVFNGLKSMDTLDADKPLLLKLGLPSPNKCILEDNKIGAKRTCQFDNGQIVTEITDYQQDSLLQMKVIEYTLTGIKWFSFKDAWYTFERVGSETNITRTTTYTSVLKPRIYWEPIEKYGIAQEHLFVLESLKKNLGEGE